MSNVLRMKVRAGLWHQHHHHTPPSLRLFCIHHEGKSWSLQNASLLWRFHFPATKSQHYFYFSYFYQIILTESLPLMASGPAKETSMAWDSDDDRWATLSSALMISNLRLNMECNTFCLGSVYRSYQRPCWAQITPQSTMDRRTSIVADHFRVNQVPHGWNIGVVTASIALSIYSIGTGLQLKTFLVFFHTTINDIWWNGSRRFTLMGRPDSYLMDLLCR